MCASYVCASLPFFFLFYSLLRMGRKDCGSSEVSFWGQFPRVERGAFSWAPDRGGAARVRMSEVGGVVLPVILEEGTGGRG